MSNVDTKRPDTSNGCPALLSAGHPFLYRENAFRVSGLPVESGPREISKHLDKLRMAQKYGATDTQRTPLMMIPPPDEQALRNALHKLNDPEKRLIDEFFWFWPNRLGQSRNDDVLALLADGHIDNASQRWLIMEQDSESLVSMHNLAVLYHCLALDIEAAAFIRALTYEEVSRANRYWDLAFKRWKIVLDHEPFWSRLSARIRAFDDPRLTTGLARRMRECLPLALLSINADLAVRFAEAGDMAGAKRQLAVMSSWDLEAAGAGREDKEDNKKTCLLGITGGVALEALKRALETLRQRIKSICRSAKTKTDKDGAQGSVAANDLLEQANPLLKILDALLPAEDVTREAAFDEVAGVALRCNIEFGNKTDKWKDSLKLLKRVKPIAATQALKSRIQDNLDTVNNNFVYCTCWFCQENPAEMSAALEVPMYGNVVRTPTYSGTHIQYRHGNMSVPRCGVCEKVHVRLTARLTIWMTVGGVVGFIVPLIILRAQADRSSDGGWVLICMLLCGIGIGIGRLKARKGSPSGIRPKSAAKEFPSIRKLYAEGWSFGTKPTS